MLKKKPSKDKPIYMFNCHKCRRVQPLITEQFGIADYCIPGRNNEQSYYWEGNKLFCRQYEPISAHKEGANYV